MQACHHAESLAQAEERLPTPAELAELRAVWEETSARVRPLLADDADPINVCEQDLLAVEQAVQAGASGQELVAMLRALRHDRAELVLGRMAEQAEALARRLGVCKVRCVVQAEALRFDPAPWGGVWSAMVHVVRNAVDHGGQDAEARAAQGKPAALCLRFEARCQPDGTTLVAVSDDGAGIDWERVRLRARERGCRAPAARICTRRCSPMGCPRAKRSAPCRGAVWASARCARRARRAGDAAVGAGCWHARGDRGARRGHAVAHGRLSGIDLE